MPVTLLSPYLRSVIVGTDYNTKKARLWGAGRLEELLALKESIRCSAVMVNVDILTPLQQKELHAIFRVPIYDRYNVVLAIFKHYARSEIARLQIALAEIPYLKHRLRYVRESSECAEALHVLPSTPGRTGFYIFVVNVGFDESPLETGLCVLFGRIKKPVVPTSHSSSYIPAKLESEFSVEELRLREQQLRKRLREEVEDQRRKESTVAQGRPTVAVVGYTNAGKTSLIKRLTGSDHLKPIDRLFATVDTSLHSARLPLSGRAVCFADTIGFLYDLPVHLLAAFEATLAHVVLADAVVHVSDISNPDWAAQDEEVRETLARLGFDKEQMHHVITVHNKCDLCYVSTHTTRSPEISHRISCKTGEGIPELVREIEEKVLTRVNCRRRSLALRFESPAIQWLYKEGFVSSDPEATAEHLKFIVYMTDEEFARFRAFSQTMGRRIKEPKL